MCVCVWLELSNVVVRQVVEEVVEVEEVEEEEVEEEEVEEVELGVSGLAVTDAVWLLSQLMRSGHRGSSVNSPWHTHGPG